eukprot:scaffold2871_cov106-Isochrysis_galbana.AAC.4
MRCVLCANARTHVVFRMYDTFIYLDILGRGCARRRQRHTGAPLGLVGQGAVLAGAGNIHCHWPLAALHPHKTQDTGQGFTSEPLACEQLAASSEQLATGTGSTGTLTLAPGTGYCRLWTG